MSHVQRQQLPSVIVIGGGISGVAAARVLYDASFKVIVFPALFTGGILLQTLKCSFCLGDLAGIKG